MKKILIVGSCFAVALTGFSAYSMNIKPFVGGNLAVNGVVWADDVKDPMDAAGIDLPTSLFGIGFEAGVKFNRENMYIPALTVAYDYMFNSEADIDAVTKPNISSFDVGFSAISATFDNYLRVSGNSRHRQDIIFGIGLGSATERVTMKTTSLGKANGYADIDEDENGTIFIFKIGYNYQISNHVDWYLNGRWFFPTESKRDIESLFNMNAGIRFLF